MSSTPVFKTPEDQAAFFDRYDTTLRRRWPVPHHEITTRSRFGSTHVIVSGPQDGPPLVLLHGFITTLVMWAPNIADLSREYRVYAIDTMGQPSKSIPEEPMVDVEDLVEWLDLTLIDLNLDRVYMAGMSTGAWIGLNYAMARPERVQKLALLSPAASFQPLVKQFMVRGMLSGVIRTRRMMYSLMGWMGLDSSDEFVEDLLDLMWAGGTHFRMPPETRRLMPAVFSDDELRGLRVPVLLLIGENEVLYDAANAMGRARELIDDFQGELIPNCSHDMSMTRHDEVDARILTFLSR
jgi:pimeloyl-ACP methyl ester carboxylesterase